MTVALTPQRQPQLLALPYEVLLTRLSGIIRPAQGVLALLFVDLPEISRMRALLGYPASSDFLSTLGHACKSALGERCTVLRYGDGGLCVLVSAIRNHGHAVLAAEKITHAAEEAVTAAGLALKPKMNIGIAMYPSHAMDIELLLRKAQMAAAAAHQRDLQLLVFDDACAEQVLESWQLAGAFAAALREGELQMHYQPKLRVADGSPAGVEALMRWLRAGRPVSTPDVFVPLAEASGLIQDVTWYALSNALQLSARCGGLPVAVNVTPGMLHHREFLDMMHTAISTMRIAPHCLTVEVTEGALIANFAQATARLTAVRKLGVRVSIDDFGTGYSSLSYFKNIPADELKIDKSFVLNLLEDEADQRVVHTIVNLAHQFHLEVVAEGVENQATLGLLARMGCDYAQGHLFARALDEVELRAWLLHASAP